MIELNINNENIDDLFTCNPLDVISLTIKKTEKITDILNYLKHFINLQKLDLSFNKIKKIRGLNNLINLKKLYLIETQIEKIDGLDNLINLQELDLSINKITEIKGLDNLVNLKELILSSNKITVIYGLDNLKNLQKLNLRSNKIYKIEGLDNLINLRFLDLRHNHIYEMENLTNLISLQILDLYNNCIKEIKGLDNLINLHTIYLIMNQINELPISLCNLRNLIKFSYSNNPIEHIPLPVQRLLNRFIYNDSQNIYNDGQNVHNHYIQTSFRNSLSNILKDKPTITLNTVKKEIIESEILTELTKREILNYCDDPTTHSTYLITYSDLLIYVWSRIHNKNEILSVLNQEISDGLCMCFTGRLTRLLNVLVGFYDDIELQISDGEQITNIIMSLKKSFDGDELKDQVKKELLDRQYKNEIIEEWLEFI